MQKSSSGSFFTDNIAAVQESNPKKWWAAVKRIGGLSSSKEISTLVYNDLAYCDMDLANLFNDKFVAVGSTLPSLQWSPLPVAEIPAEFYISVEDTEAALLASKLHSAPGPDGIAAWFLRENAELLSRPLCSIFNASVRQGFVPSLWKSANVTPIPKSSPALNVDSDFRPISLTPIVSKILESFIYSWLSQSIVDQIDPLQFGSLPGSSTTMALVYLLHKWYEACDELGSSLRICLLDFSKAFDRIDHNIVLDKLQRMDVHPVLVNWIADFLSGRMQRTRVGQFFSDWKHVNSGVPQGTKLGPLLFLIMVNDLRNSPNLVKYVDDTTVWEVLSKNSSSNFPAIVDECANWASANNMKLNESKTKELQVCFSSQPVTHPAITINNVPVDIVKHAKLLGVTISSDLKWNLHIDNICKKASKKLYALRLLRRNGIPTSTLLSVYCTCIRPTLEYACEVWHGSLQSYLNDQIEAVQKRALRIIYSNLSYKDAMVTANIDTLEARRVSLCARLFRNMTCPSHKIHSLLPQRRSLDYSLRRTRTFSIPKFRTERFRKSFIPSRATYFDIL